MNSFYYSICFLQPKQHSPVVISSNVLLDEQPPDLHSINITSAGRLVWSPHANITLRTKFIYINGRLDIGSEDCPFTGIAKIILTGHTFLCFALCSCLLLFVFFVVCVGGYSITVSACFVLLIL
jgi:hypothetical protein